MPSSLSPSLPSSFESEAAEALLLLSNHQPFIWGSRKKRSLRYKSESDSKITVKEEIRGKVAPEILSPSTPLSFNSISDDPAPPPLEVPPRSPPAKRLGEILKEKKENFAVLVQDNLNLRKNCFEMRRHYMLLLERNAWLKKIKEDLVLNEQRMFLMAEERKRRWREVYAAARKRRKQLMREKVEKKSQEGQQSEQSQDLGEEDGGERWRERYGAARKRRIELMRDKADKKRQRL